MKTPRTSPHTPLRALLLCGLLFGAATAPAQTSLVKIPPGATAHQDLVYAEVNGVQLKLDLFMPNNDTPETPVPLIVWVHGGAWKLGGKANPFPLEHGFLERGYAIASISYRFTTTAQFPAQLQDCKAAIRWLRAHAAKYNFDPARIGAWGSSAGGHLVTLLGLTDGKREFDTGAHLDVSSGVQAVVNFYGPMDLTGNPGSADIKSIENLIVELIGGPISEKMEQAVSASPLSHVSKNAAPLFTVQGTDDKRVHVGHARIIHDAMTKAGAFSKITLLEGAGHGGKPFSDAKLLDEIDSFLSTHLKPRQENPPPAANPGKARASAASVRPGTPFGDNAVLQAGMKIPVWGKAAPGETVAVSFAGQSKQTTAGANGGWRVELDPMPAGTSGELVIGDKTFTNVVTGEVWFVGGQSNATLSLKRATPNSAAEIARADFPQIRVWTSKYTIAKTPQDFGAGEWRVCTPATAGNFTGMGYFFAKGLTAARDGVPVGIISCNQGGAPVFSMMPAGIFDSDPKAQKVEEHFAANLKRSPKSTYLEKAVIWNGMIHPLAPYAMRGVLWNQGEADVRVAPAYESLFARMVASWRALWGRDDLPFYVVQLANISDKGSYEPAGSFNWPLIREAQAYARKIPNVWVSVGIDIGDLTDIPNDARHPANKREIGERLVPLALANTYGVRDDARPRASPFFEKAVVGDDKITCHFDDAAKGLKTRDGKPAGGFEIAGSNGKFVPATATIEGETIVVSASSVKSPAAVRYAWSNTCEGANVINASGLPLAPFHYGKRAPNVPQTQRTTDSQIRENVLFAGPTASRYTASRSAADFKDAARASVRPGTPFANNAVLQAGVKVPVWGTTSPGERVTVSFAGQSKEATAGASGVWRVDLDPMPAGTSGELVIGDKTFTNVITGEVWFASGQTAGMALRRSTPEADAEIARANFPQIRVWTSKYTTAQTPQDFGEGEWRVCTPANAANLTGLGYFFAKGLSAARGGAPVGIVNCGYGGAPIISNMDAKFFDQTPDAKKVEAVFTSQLSRAPQNTHLAKAAVWNAMVNPLAPYAMRGVLFMQGEAETRVAYAYETLFAAMARSWRVLWGRDDLPFYVVQLANISDKGSYEPAGSLNWPLVREAQANARLIPNVWVAVGIDTGNLSDDPREARFPKNRRELGERLVMLALANTYGEPGDGSPRASPFFEKARIRGDKVICHFDAAAAGLKTRDGKPVGGFEIAGADGKFVPATATIEGETIVVTSPDVKAPVSMRYAWSNTCEGANVVNASGLPLSPFRASRQ